jgi:hypothetical protein
MSAFSPTGYWAHLYIRTRAGVFVGYRSVTPAKPILYWNDSGEPVIADEAGRLVTPAQYAADHAEEVEVREGYIGHSGFTVQPYPKEVGR